MAEGNGYVKWKSFGILISIIFTCISVLFGLYATLKDTSFEDKLNTQQQFADIKEQLHELQWLNELKPKTDNTTAVNIYSQIEDKTSQREEFIHNLKQYIEEE